LRAFGWHPAFAANLPSGGPAYPFATPGVRLKYEPTDNIAILAALFNGDLLGRVLAIHNCETATELTSG